MTYFQNLEKCNTILNEIKKNNKINTVGHFLSIYYEYGSR